MKARLIVDKEEKIEPEREFASIFVYPLTRLGEEEGAEGKRWGICAQNGKGAIVGRSNQRGKPTYHFVDCMHFTNTYIFA